MEVKFDTVDPDAEILSLSEIGLQSATTSPEGVSPTQIIVSVESQGQAATLVEYLTEHHASHDDVPEWIAEDAQYEIEGWRELNELAQEPATA